MTWGTDRDPPIPEPRDGGPAFPEPDSHFADGVIALGRPGMSRRDWFAGMMQADDRLVKVIRALDDHDLALFALHPQLEDEEAIALAGEYTGMDRVEQVEHRLRLEAKAIARCRFIQADAMIEESQQPTRNDHDND